MIAQEVKKDDSRPYPPRREKWPPPRSPKPPKTEAVKKDEAAKKEPEKAAPVETPPPTIPKEVEEKLEKARLAVAEAIVAAQDAGLVDTSIDPPPILDILIKGYAIDA